MEAGPDAALVLPNRKVVGQRLADRLKELRGEEPIVLGIPPGGVPVALELSHALGAEFDIIVALKVAAPENARRALGAVAEFGGRVVSARRLEQTDNQSGDLLPEFDRTTREVSRLAKGYRQERPAPTLEDRTVVVVADGVVEPLIARAALRGVSSRSPRRLIFATGVLARVTLIEVRRDVREAVALREPDYLFSVAEWYRELPPVSDAEIQASLRPPVLGIAP